MSSFTSLFRPRAVFMVILCSILATALYVRIFASHSNDVADEASGPSTDSSSARLHRRHGEPFGSAPALSLPESHPGPDPLSNVTTHLLAQRQTVSTGSVTYYCGVGKPCSNGACCGESGVCGYGPTYCGDGCTSNCDAHAPCGQYSESGSATCPLNVCCSQYGFCGTTSDFCGSGCQSNCRTPGSPSSGGDVRQTVIGYYESWAASRECSNIADPTQIPVEGLTGLNFAFAYIVPASYDIVPMGGVDEDLFARVTNTKIRNPDLKVVVSIGGWSFSDDDQPTQSVFPDIASTVAKRELFSHKLYQFMVQYGFDGVDLDWEYPGAPDRGGTVSDVGNYPLLLSTIRSFWRGQNKAYTLSITAPTSYWYLRWFDLQGIAQAVDYINLMAYDLHGVWDSADPIGPFVYAHTNLTEIDAALSLFWRNNISPDQINLGLAFYGRSFTLLDPSCTTPDCPFIGPGPAGFCSNTPGILTFTEIQLMLSRYSETGVSYYDSVDAVNYFVYGPDNNLWVSYDDSVTYKQKIDYANSQGLHGIFIWAVDMDDGAYTALKAVTGDNLTPEVPESDTLGHWNVKDCYTTQCNEVCKSGFMAMTGLNLDANGQGCPDAGRNNHQRTFCCPPWGAPDPGTCRWRGSGHQCYGQCLTGEVLMTADNYGESTHCDHGVKAYCCPATSGDSAAAACKAVHGGCPADLPQKIGTISSDYAYSSDDYCCPASPVWNNCAWHGSAFTCANNRCPIGQIELATDKSGGGDLLPCIFGRQQAFCCDPPFDGTAFVPVALEDLFPETLPADEPPVYYEAFSHAPNENPRYDSSNTEDPDREPFAWTIMVGAEADVQSLRKRDGSHLETFDCPQPEASDYGVQRLKALCMVDGDDHNCEDINVGGARGTVIRLPEECGPDEWVRVISFKRLGESEDVPLPSHLRRRAPPSPKVYEITYDYNFRLLRRGGGEVYVRFDASDHPGYWSTIVSSSPNGSIIERDAEIEEAEDWRAFHMAWFNHHKISKRGFGTTDSWWLDRYNLLLSTRSGGIDYGVTQSWSWNQILYSAQKNCPPSFTAYMECVIYGELTAQLDFGMSFIGTLRNFDFSEAYAYFRFNGLDMSTKVELNGNAAFSFQSQKLPLLDSWSLFGAGFSIKGLWTIGPYFEVDAQIQALATVSGSVSSGVQMKVPVGGYTFMFPQSMNQFPNPNLIEIVPLTHLILPGESATISTAGSLTVSVTPAIGFGIELDALGLQLINTKAVGSFTHAFTLGVDSNSPSCDGVSYEIVYGLEANIDLIAALPGWSTGPQHVNVYQDRSALVPLQCYSWAPTHTGARRSLEYSSNLTSRAPPPFNFANSGALFPDLFGSLISCPNDIDTPTGDCHVKVADYGDDPTDGGAISGPSSSKRAVVEDVESETSHILEKRGYKPPVTFCEIQEGRYSTEIIYRGPGYPSSGELIAAENTYSFSTYGPLNPDDCNDYGFGVVPTPPPSDSGSWATEHILEWQLLGDFWSDFVSGKSFEADNPVSPTSPQTFSPMAKYDICRYLNFWWAGRPFIINRFDGTPVNILASAFPGTSGTPGTYRNELTLIDKETNNLKEMVWSSARIRQDTKMSGFINGDVNKAINVCKNLLNAITYMQISATASTLVTQATRIGTYMDNIETFLASYNNANFNKLPYTKQNLGSEWRKWVHNQHTLANAKYLAFMNKWIPEIVKEHATEQNTAIVTRINALTTAYAAIPAWENPFPANWA